MGIRPMDMQIVMPKATEPNAAGRNTARPDLQTQQFAQQLQKQLQVESKQVVELSKTERERAEQDAVDKDGHNKQEKRQNRGGGQDAGDKEQAKPKQSQVKKMIDISI